MKVSVEKDAIESKPSIMKKVNSFAGLAPYLSKYLLDSIKYLLRYYQLKFQKALKQVVKNANKENDFDNIERV